MIWIKEFATFIGMMLFFALVYIVFSFGPAHSADQVSCSCGSDLECMTICGGDGSPGQ